MLALLSGVILGALLNVYLYNKIVNTTYLLKDQGNELGKLQVASADLKNNLYKILDSGNLIKVADQLSLVKDPHPKYLEITGSGIATGN